MMISMACFTAPLSSRRDCAEGWLGLNEMTLTEKDFRKYILQEYTFLKRPVIVMDKAIFIGNAPKTVKAMVEAAGK